MDTWAVLLSRFPRSVGFLGWFIVGFQNKPFGFLGWFVGFSSMFVVEVKTEKGLSKRLLRGNYLYFCLAQVMLLCSDMMLRIVILLCGQLKGFGAKTQRLWRKNEKRYCVFS